MDSASNKDTIEVIRDCRTDFRLRSCQMLMTMCADIGEAVQGCDGQAVPMHTKQQLLACRKAMIGKIENIHKCEQRDGDVAKELLRKNQSYRRIRFNECELAMLEQIIELKNNPKRKGKKKKSKGKKKKSPKSFLSRAGDEQKHKNYKEFMVSKQEEFNQKMSANLTKIAPNRNGRPATPRQLPPIAPRGLENVKEIAQVTQSTQQQQQQVEAASAEHQQILQRSESATLELLEPSPPHSERSSSASRKRRFELGNPLTLKNQISDLRQLKKIKLDDLSKPTKPKHIQHFHDIRLPGQL